MNCFVVGRNPYIIRFLGGRMGIFDLFKKLFKEDKVDNSEQEIKLGFMCHKNKRREISIF